MLKQVKHLSSLILLIIMLCSCKENHKQYVGFMNNEHFLDMKEDVFNEGEYGFKNFEISNATYTVYTKINQIEFDTVHSITESYYFNNNNKLEKAIFVYTMYEDKVDSLNYKNIFMKCCRTELFLDGSNITYTKKNYPRINILWKK